MSKSLLSDYWTKLGMSKKRKIREIETRAVSEWNCEIDIRKNKWEKQRNKEIETREVREREKPNQIKWQTKIREKSMRNRPNS